MKRFLIFAVWLYRTRPVQYLTHHIPGRRRCAREGATCSELMAGAHGDLRKMLAIAGVSSLGGLALIVTTGCNAFGSCPPGEVQNRPGNQLTTSCVKS